MPEQPLDDCCVEMTRIDRLTIKGTGGFACGREVGRYLESLGLGYRVIGLACAADEADGPGSFVLRLEKEAIEPCE